MQLLEIQALAYSVVDELPRYRDRMRLRYLNAKVLPQLTSIVDQFQAAVREYFSQAESRLIARILENPPPSRPVAESLREAEEDEILDAWWEAIWNPEDEAAEISRILEPHIDKAARAGHDKAIAMVGLELGLDVYSPISEEWFKKHTTRFADRAARGITQTTERRIKKTLIDGWRAGEDMHRLTTRTQLAFDEGRRFRAERIARKETIQANNITAIETYKELGVEQSELIGCTPTCAECQAVIAQCPVSHERAMELEAGLHPNHIGSWVPVIPEGWKPALPE